MRDILNEMALSCSSGGSHWTSGRISSRVVKESVVRIGRGCPGMWWSHCPWKRSRNNWMWYLVLWSNPHGGVQSNTEHDDLRDLFQYQWFRGSKWDSSFRRHFYTLSTQTAKHSLVFLQPRIKMVSSFTNYYKFFLLNYNEK